MKLLTEGKILNIADKGKGALVDFELTTYDTSNGSRDLLFINIISLFIRGIGGFGFKGDSKFQTKALPSKPSGSPTTTVT
jgi:3-hydroxyacyl-CoA dehydrogenase/3a,7a,12a-trihydroxy-5b-cholest-24-enoyl-CoA hydratase/multifunctional beta-oxidation protein/peroxisomal enoyl-CoA hydratase 2